MMKFIEKWLFSHYEVIPKDKITPYLNKAREKEKESTVAYYEEKMINMKKRMEEEYQFNIQETEAEINRLYKEIDTLKGDLKRSEIVYYKTIQRSKVNFRIANEMKFYAKKYMEDAINSFQSVQKLYDNAQEHNDSIEEEEKKDKILLSID